MKKLVLLAFCLVYVFIANAGSVTEQQALQKARQFMQGKNLSMTQQTSQAGLDCDGITPFYVFNAEKNGGFVIVSADDRTKPILGYADESCIQSAKTRPGADCDSDHELLIGKLRFKLKKVGKPLDHSVQFSRSVVSDSLRPHE